MNEYRQKRKDCVSKKAPYAPAAFNTATELFIKQGFDNVTVSDIAAAAKVSKMTVFNYFPRKEELYFDRIDEIRQLLQDALERHRTLAPVAVFRALTRELIEQEHPLIRIDRRVADFWQGVAASPALRVYARNSLPN
ncbi:hypothetical protein DMH27_25495 [Raoultella planticola]|nr:hypothetical protein [Raoultella planticola]